MTLGPTEADTCADYVLPAIRSAGWGAAQVREQYPVMADLQIPTPGDQYKRRADYVLELDPGVPLVVIEAKRLWALPGDGLQQAIRYAAMLDAPLALSTNGDGWVLHNRISGSERRVDSVPTPVEAWDLFTESHGLNAMGQELLRAQFSTHHRSSDGNVRQLRYYQHRAIHNVLAAMSRKEKRLLLVMATGTGKTFTAMQLVWKLWNYRRRQQQHQKTAIRNYRVLYLADRDVLVGDPMDKTFSPAFGEAVMRVSSKDRRHSPDIYFATYQALDVSQPDHEDDTGESLDLLSNYPADFFDLVIVDECHRGSARAESNWRAILDHFSPATQLGLTATPVSAGTADTYDYFGNPVYEYSLREGIEDGFLAPYTIRRVQFDTDVDGVEIPEGMVDISGQELPAGVYTTRDFERSLSLPDRTRAMARVIDRVVGDTTDRAVVFCVDSDHALTMVESLRNLRPERTAANAEWVARIMSVERDKARLLEEFTDPERDVPQIAISTRLLSTGVDVQDLRYVIIARSVGSIAEFKQIIGRGTRLYPDKNKYEFEIIDFVGATATFSDPGFDGPPLKPPIIDTVGSNGDVVEPPGSESNESADTGEPVAPSGTVEEPEPPYISGGSSNDGDATQQPSRSKFELQGVSVEIVAEGFWVHDLDSGKPRLVSYIDWTRERMLSAFAAPEQLLAAWSEPQSRTDVVSALRRARIDIQRLAVELGNDTNEPIDTVDQLVQLAWNRPAPTRAERARTARSRHADDFAALSVKARAILDALLDIYARDGIEEISSTAVLLLAPLPEQGTPAQIAREFGGAERWHEAREQLQRWLYTA